MASKSKKSDEPIVRIEKKLDVIIRLLEDNFILEAGKVKMGRDNIREVLKVHTTRISAVMKGLK